MAKKSAGISVKFGEGNSEKCMISFLVVDLPSPYNVIIGRPTLRELEAVISMNYLLMKFPTDRRVGLVFGQKDVDSELVAWEVAQEEKKKEGKEEIDTLEPRVKEENGMESTVEELDKVLLFEGKLKRRFKLVNSRMRCDKS